MANSRTISKNVNRKGKSMEDCFSAFLLLLQPEINKYLSKRDKDLLSLDKIDIKDAQRGGSQAGKDKTVILTFSTSNGKIEVPILTEVKAHEAEEKPNKLELPQKINAIKHNESNQYYIRDPQFTGASFLLFIPLGKRAPNTEYENTLAFELKPEQKEFPDYAWEIDREFLNVNIFQLFENLCLEVNEAKDKKGEYLFINTLNPLIDVGKKTSLLLELAKVFISNIEISIKKHSENYLRKGAYFKNINFDSPIAAIQSQSKYTQISNPLENQVKIIDLTKRETTKKEIVSAEAKRTEYLCRSLLIQYYGGLFGKKMPEIEKNYSSQIIKSGIWEEKFDNFRSIEKEIRQIVNTYSFDQFDEGIIIKQYLFANESALLGCFYENMANNGLCTYEVDGKITVKK